MLFNLAAAIIVNIGVTLTFVFSLVLKLIACFLHNQFRLLVFFQLVRRQDGCCTGVHCRFKQTPCLPGRVALWCSEHLWVFSLLFFLFLFLFIYTYLSNVQSIMKGPICEALLQFSVTHWNCLFFLFDFVALD